MSYLELLHAAKSRQRAEKLNSLNSPDSGGEREPPLVQWDDVSERERLRGAVAWCDARWWRGAWEWCRTNRGDFYRRLDDTLLDIDAAFSARDVRENTRACEALKLVVADIMAAYRDAQQMNGTEGPESR